MGKTLIQQARGHGSLSYRVRRQAFKYRIQYPRYLEGEGKVVKLLNSLAHSAPLAKIKFSKGTFYTPASKGLVEGSTVSFEKKSDPIKDGDVLKVKYLPVKTKVYNIESRPGDGGRFVRTGGNSAIVSRIMGEKISILLPSKKEKIFHPECRATVGVIAGAGRLDKPLVKAGKNYHIKKSKGGRIWPRTSAVKMNAIDHPFGSGRGKNPKSKIAQRNAPPGKKVGLIRPRRTGHRK